MGSSEKASGKCRIYVCNSPAVIRGYCLVHYERHITPPKSWPRKRLLESMQSVQRMLETEYVLRLPRGLVPSTAGQVSQEEMRRRYKEVRRIFDTSIGKRLRTVARREGFGSFAVETFGLWEELSITIARALFGKIIVHPVLPNRQIPDIVPMLPGVRTTSSPEGTIYVEHAPIIVEAKRSMASFPNVLHDYGPYCDRLEVWVFRWEPRRLDWRTPGIVYKSGEALARRLETKGQDGLARFLRRLPLIWGEYEMAALYGCLS